MIDKAKIESIVAQTMSASADIQGMIVCDAKGKVLFGHTITGDIRHPEIAELAVKISATSAQLVAGIDKGGLKEIDLTADQGIVMILGDVKLVLTAIAGEAARESLGLLRMALRRALVSMVS